MSSSRVVALLVSQMASIITYLQAIASLFVFCIGKYQPYIPAYLQEEQLMICSVKLLIAIYNCFSYTGYQTCISIYN